ncbi:hypothetical protein BRC83_07780 [Halobacteriales archaeon QS_1_68_17]|nr:MAG: hypothetical protein BRC83_07780 [Halobacteriales archaeon QS_1_68_17]
MRLRQPIELAVLAGLLVVQQATTLFSTYPILEYAGLVVVFAVMVDAVRCTRRRWARIRDSATG